MNLYELMNQLPTELYAKIMYGSGIISPEAKIMKEFHSNIFIEYEKLKYRKNKKSYISHLVDLGYLKENMEQVVTLEYLYLIGYYED
tara:strand:- start:951 stop:1211 length:261 start_codon:yes stop_codon:yes gene_type:complete